MKNALILLGALMVLALLGTRGASPPAVASGITIQDKGVQISFPNTLTFSAHVAAGAGVSRVVLEYGVDKLTCGSVIAKAFPTVQAGPSADVTWTWDMHKSGSEPPGASIWYRWRVTDASGAETVSDTRRVEWLDKLHNWQSVSGGKLVLHWYSGSRAFATDLLNSAVSSLDKLKQTTGVAADSQIDMYIYASTHDMRDAVLYSPGWTGGLAFPAEAIVIIGITPDQLTWGKRAEAHEITHVLEGHRTFSCLESIPTWLNEGIAVYGEGGPDQAALSQLHDDAVADKLIQVPALSGGFSEDPSTADLSYSESYSLVNYLIAKYGQAKMIKLFDDLRDSMKLEAALRDADGVTLTGLEDGWRASVGAPPRSGAGSAPAATAVPTPVPTYAPIGSRP